MDYKSQKQYLAYYEAEKAARRMPLSYVQWLESRKKKSKRDLLKPIGRKKQENILESEFQKLRGYGTLSESDKAELRKRFGKG